MSYEDITHYVEDHDLKLFMDDRSVEYITNADNKDKFNVYLAEECAELIKELTKMERGIGSKCRVEEEIGDVIISIERFVTIYKNDLSQDKRNNLDVDKLCVKTTEPLKESDVKDLIKRLGILIYNSMDYDCNGTVSLPVMSVQLDIQCVWVLINKIIDKYELSRDYIKRHYTSTITEIIEGSK